jgi:hypothetical protein
MYTRDQMVDELQGVAMIMRGLRKNLDTIEELSKRDEDLFNELRTKMIDVEMMIERLK